MASEVLQQTTVDERNSSVDSLDRIYPHCSYLDRIYEGRKLMRLRL
jgi:hypothetical protein